MKIYLASSWRNEKFDNVLIELQKCGHSVYNFKQPSIQDSGFSWSQIDENWKNWTAEQYRTALVTRVAEHGFSNDFSAMQWADVCVLLLPCGRSAHLELGWMAGAGKATIILTQDGQEPELMAKLATCICINLEEVIARLERWQLTGSPKNG